MSTQETAASLHLGQGRRMPERLHGGGGVQADFCSTVQPPEEGAGGEAGSRGPCSADLSDVKPGQAGRQGQHSQEAGQDYPRGLISRKKFGGEPITTGVPHILAGYSAVRTILGCRAGSRCPRAGTGADARQRLQPRPRRTGGQAIRWPLQGGGVIGSAASANEGLGACGDQESQRMGGSPGRSGPSQDAGTLAQLETGKGLLGPWDRCWRVQGVCPGTSIPGSGWAGGGG